MKLTPFPKRARLQLLSPTPLFNFHQLRQSEINFDIVVSLQSEQKRFLQQHKQRSETYSKAAAMMKKQRKKSRGSTKTGLAMDKELKVMAVSFLWMFVVVCCC